MPAPATATVFVPCRICGDPIDARRAALPISHGCCVECNAPSLTTSREVLARLPEYETSVWERGERMEP